MNEKGVPVLFALQLCLFETKISNTMPYVYIYTKIYNYVYKSVVFHLSQSEMKRSYKTYLSKCSHKEFWE